MKTINVNGYEYQIKERSDWTDDFNKNFQPGDYVDQEIVDYFRDVLPPKSMSSNYLQVGEPYSHVLDQEGRYRATYNTFTKSAPGVWLYRGHCIAGETELRG